jgi:hypothetical protein
MANACSLELWKGAAYAHSRKDVWMKRSALPLVRGVQGRVRLCVSPRVCRALANSLLR